MLLRDYQQKAIDSLKKKIHLGKKRILLIAPTGAGKTIIAAAMMQSAFAKGTPTLFIANRRQLIHQTTDKLSRFNVNSGTIMAGCDTAEHLVQIASLQTLVRRKLPTARLVITDEAHHAATGSYKDVILGGYPDAIVIGLTATPWRTDKIGLGDVYEDSILVATPRELIDQGALVDYDAYCYDSPDLHEVHTLRGDYKQDELELACNTKVLVGNVVKEYLTHARGKRAICFPVGISHSKSIVAEFTESGIVAAHVDGNTPDEERKLAYEKFEAGEIKVICSVGVLSEGFDSPAAEVVILARPTKSLTLFIQQVGRGFRPSPDTGKTRLLIHDHAGNLLRHGLPDEDRDYSMDATPPRVLLRLQCPVCRAVIAKARDGKCPKCGALLETVTTPQTGPGRDEKIIVNGFRISKEAILAIREKRRLAGLSSEYTDQELAKIASATAEEKAAEFKRLMCIGETKSYKSGWAKHAYRRTFGVWPRFDEVTFDLTDAAREPFLKLRGE